MMKQRNNVCYFVSFPASLLTQLIWYIPLFAYWILKWYISLKTWLMKWYKWQVQMIQKPRYLTWRCKWTISLATWIVLIERSWFFDITGLSFEEVESFQTKTKLRCCHFSTSGKLLAAAGHDGKVDTVLLNYFSFWIFMLKIYAEDLHFANKDFVKK